MSGRGKPQLSPAPPMSRVLPRMRASRSHFGGVLTRPLRVYTLIIREQGDRPLANPELPLPGGAARSPGGHSALRGETAPPRPARDAVFHTRRADAQGTDPARGAG